jgi:hypothetical protein
LRKCASSKIPFNRLLNHRALRASRHTETVNHALT